MNTVYVSTYVVKYERQTEFQSLIKQFLKFKKANPKAFDGVKSWRIFQQEYGGVVGSYVEMWEFTSKEEMEKVIAGLMKHKEMKEIDTEFHKMVDHTTLTASTWNIVAQAKNIEKVIEQFSPFYVSQFGPLISAFSS
jgi:hypothetical protein